MYTSLHTAPGGVRYFTTIRLQGLRCKPQLGQKLNQDFCFMHTWKTPPQELKNCTCSGRKPGQEGRVGGAAQITPP